MFVPKLLSEPFDKKNRTSLTFTLFFTLFFAVALLLPLFTLFKHAFYNAEGEWVGLTYFIKYFGQSTTASSLSHSLFIATFSSLIGVLLAFLFALSTTRTRVVGRSFAQWVGYVPLFLPSITQGVALVYLLGRQGLLTRALGHTPFELYGKWGILIAMVIYLFPILFMFFRLNLNRSDQRLYEFSYLCGVSDIKQFFLITLKQQRYTFLIAFCAGFILAFSDFGIPKSIGGNYNLLATDIYKQVIGQQNISIGAVLGLLLLIPTLIFNQLEKIFGKKNLQSDSQATSLQVQKNWLRDTFLGLIMWVLVSVILSLLLVIFYSSFITQWPYNMSFTLKNYAPVSFGPSIASLLGQTVLVALASALLGTMLTFLCGFFVTQLPLPRWLNRSFNFCATIPNSVPGLSIGLAFIYFFNQSGNPFNFFYGTFGIIILANIIHFFTTPYLNTLQAMRRIGPEYTETARIFGISTPRYIFKTLIPLSFDLLLENFSYLFTNSMITISAIVFLYSAQTQTVGLVMINLLEQGSLERVTALATLLFCTNLFFRLFLYQGVLKLYRRVQRRKQTVTQSVSSHEEKLDLLQEVFSVSDNQSTGCWLEFGTLLSFYRGQATLPFSSKLTIGVKQSQLTERFFQELLDRDLLSVNPTDLNSPDELLKHARQKSPLPLFFGYKSTRVEFYIFEEEGESIFCHCYENEELVRYDFPKINPQPLTRFGLKLLAPQPITSHLKLVYGERFEESDPLWDNSLSGNRTVIKEHVKK